MSPLAGAADRLRRQGAGPGFRRLLLTAELVFGLALLRRGIELAKDSSGYLEGAVFRAPLYPLILEALELVFGRHALTATLVGQITFGLVAVAALVLYLRRAIELPDWLAWLAAALLLVPYAGPLAVANRVLSEALAYPLFLLAVRSLLGAILEDRWGRFAAATGWAAALVLTRQQFLFLWPLLTLCALLWLLERSVRRRGLAALALVVTVASGVELADRGYRLVRHGRFARAPFAGLQLLAGALYVSPGALAERLPAAQRDLFVALHAEGRERRLLAEANPSPGGVASYAWHFRQGYNEIVWRLIVPAMRERIGGDDWFAVEAELLPLARALIRAEPLAFLRLYVANLLSALGVWYAMLLGVITPLTLARGLAHRSAPDLAAGLLALSHLANCALVALVEPLKMRYSFYTDGLLLVLLVLLVARGSQPARSHVRNRG